MKKLLQTVSILGILTLAAACGNGAPSAEAAEGYHINMTVLPGPSALGSLGLMRDAAEGNTQNSYSIQILGTPEEVVPMIVQGTVDIAAVPTNMASVLHNNPNVDVTVLGISTMGVLHIVDTTGEIATIADLEGRTVYFSGLGAAPEFVFNYILRQNGLEPNVDVILQPEAEHPQIAVLMAVGQAEIALLPEPFATTVTMQNENAVHALDLTEEWNRVQPNYGLVMTSIIVRSEFLAENPDAVNIFMAEYAQSVQFVNGNVEAAAQLAVDFGVIPSANIAAAAIPRSNQVFITGAQMRIYLEGYLGVLYAELPASVGGAMPNETFYFIP
ncbi:MAG: ABC transporter substrate-binding protein [Defluviitaleaceae bacterium]|nr:ABC transporter substrate-binding protein [Defluviitaleaceae bacterium]